MKRVLFVLIGAVALLALLATPALASAQTFVVYPAGKTADMKSNADTVNIQKAFDAAVVAGPGSTVQLGRGHFYINTVLVRNFVGTFRGAGEHRTVIDCLRGLDSNLPGVTPVAPVPVPGAVAWPFLVGFVGGNVSVSDLSFHITAFSPVDAASNGGSDVLQGIVTVIGNPHASSAFDRVSITAGHGSDRGFNADEDLIIAGYVPTDQNGNPTSFGYLHGSESVCDCSFVGHDGLQVQGLTKGSLQVSASSFACVALSCLLDDASASQITICHNQMQNSSGACVFLYQGWIAGGNGDPTLLPPLPAPRYLICDNHMIATGTASAFFAEDDSLVYGADNRLHATIAGNTMNLDTTGAGIGEFATRDFWVLDNRFSGSAYAGMYLGDDLGGPDGTTLYPVSGWKIIGNDLHSLTTSMASIILGNGSSHCLVVGGPPPTTVLNNGTDNILINVNKLPLSNAARAAAPRVGSLRQMKSLKEMMKRF